MCIFQFHSSFPIVCTECNVEISNTLRFKLAKDLMLLIIQFT
jgi:hypothetical protein